MKLAVVISMILSLAGAVFGAELTQVSTGEEGGHFAAILQFDAPVTAEDIKVDVLKDALDVTFANSRVAGDKNFVEVGQQNIKSIATSASGKDVLTKIIFAKAVNPETFKDSYRVVPQNDQVKILFKTPEQEWSLAALGIDGILPVSLDGDAPAKEGKSPLAPEFGERVPVTASEDAKAEFTDIANKKEHEIPVLTSINEKKVESRSPFARLALSLGVIMVLVVGLVQFSKWWQKRHGKTVDNNRIRILTQHHLGPKKSLAIIRVAGETILIGVTDHNISMIKTLALLEDEEVPDLLPQTFAGEMRKKTEDADDGAEDSAFAQIRDRISKRVKEMRPL